MKNTNKHDEYEQLNIDIVDEGLIADTIEEIKPAKRAKRKDLEVGAAITINPEIKRFCDGMGIPDYARKAYIKRINPANKTVLIETEPNGKELGVLFMSDVVLT